MATYHKQHGLNVAIVRPSLVTGLAGLPYPGYCGNVAGERVYSAALSLYFGGCWCTDLCQAVAAWGWCCASVSAVWVSGTMIACHARALPAWRGATACDEATLTTALLLLLLLLLQAPSAWASPWLWACLTAWRVWPWCPHTCGTRCQVGGGSSSSSSNTMLLSTVPTHVWDAVPGGW